MFDGAFSFHGRIGRLRYFLSGLLLGVGALVGVAGIVLVVVPAAHSPGAMIVLVGLGLIGLVAMVWFDLSLHVRRIHDIGWDAWVVIPGWLVANVADTALAHLVPRLATDAHHYHTWFGTIGDLALSLALLFWPGREDGESRTARAVRVFDAPTPAIRAAVTPRPAAQGFGRRGLR